MSQNTSSAVMNQRREPKDSLDYFPTPPWATRALCEHVLRYRVQPMIAATAWEPACGEGHMVRPLKEYFGHVTASDVQAYPGAGAYRLHDFLLPGRPIVEADWIVTNPPFNLAEDFARRALEVTRRGVALLVRTNFLEGQKRWRLFRDHPPAVVAQFAERVPMFRGRLDAAGSSATSYAWFVWDSAGGGFRLDSALTWIPPCRSKLERAEDYAPAPGPAQNEQASAAA